MKFRLHHVAIAALLLGSAVVHASAYRLNVPIPAKSLVSPGGPGTDGPGEGEGPETPVALKVELFARTLAEAKVGKPYDVSFADFLNVTGEGSEDFKASDVSWALKGGAIPAGLTFSSAGQVSGTPTAEGTSAFTVVATFMTADGEQGYTIKVGNSYLKVLQVVNGHQHTCAITTARTVKCWGVNWVGQLGTGDTNSTWVPVDTVGLTGVTQLAAGYQHTCALTGGRVKCWGANFNNQTGQDEPGNQFYDPILIPQEVKGLGAGATNIAAGNQHSCAVVEGALQCWGSNWYGQLGNGANRNDVNLVTNVQGLTSGVTQVGVGPQVTCAVVSGSAMCWGGNDFGQLGSGNTTDSLTPRVVTGLTSGVTQVALSSVHACAIVSGAAKCWGQNDSGHLGDGSTSARLVPTQVSGLTANVTQIATGAVFTCAVVSGQAKCWGQNDRGELGNGGGASSLVPVNVSGLDSGVTSISAGSNTACATAGGVAKCWGDGNMGRLGNNSEDSSPVPVGVTDPS